MSRGEALAAAAERLVGCPFRLRGRDPRRGLDCAGLVSAALAEIGTRIAAPEGYSLRCLDDGGIDTVALAAGLMAASGTLKEGDVVLVRPGPAQLHLLIAVAGGAFVHAHAGLRRVVRTPGPLPWPVERRWRLQAE